MQYLKYLILESLSPDEIHDKYYKKLSFLIFDRIVAADPTSKVSESGEVIKVGRYSKWMLKLYNDNQLLLEDLYKFTRSLNLFHLLNIRGILKRKNIPSDINYYKNLPDLWSNIKEFYDDSNAEILKISNKEYELFWENDLCKVVIPLTHEASCYFGKDSDWCTASDSSNYYDQYSAQGPLFIIIDKADLDISIKYQFHLESHSFADIDDDMLGPDEILGILEHYKLSNDFIELVFLRNKTSKSEAMSISLDGLFFYLKDRWYLKFEDWTSFHDHIYLNNSDNYKAIFEILDGDVPEIFESYYSIKDIDSFEIYDTTLEKIISILEETYPEIFKTEDVASHLLKLKNNKYKTDVKHITKLLELFDDNDDTVVLEMIRDCIVDSYNQLYNDEVSIYYFKDLVECISNHFNFMGTPEYRNYDKSYHVPLSEFDMTDIFIKSVTDDESRSIEYYLDKDPSIYVDEDDLNSDIIERLNDIG